MRSITPRRAAALGLGGAALLVGPGAEPAGAQPAPGPALVFKPGYAFDPNTIAPLGGFAVERDVTRVDLRNDLGVQRRLILSDGLERVFITIGVAQGGPVRPDDMLNAAALESEMAPEDRFFFDVEDQYGVGETLFASTNSTPEAILGECLFLRRNVFVSIADREADPTLDLTPIAAAIDAQIDALPDLTLDQLQAHVPQIDVLDVDVAQLEPGGAARIVVGVSDPFRVPTTLVFEAPHGEVLETDDADLVYQAGVEPPPEQLLTAVVVNANLLVAEASQVIETLPLGDAR